MNRHQFKPRHCQRIAAALAIALLLFHGAAGAAEEASAVTTACATSISACGCTITKSGTYTVTADLFEHAGTHGGGDCIAIKASKVILNTADFSITSRSALYRSRD